MHQFSYKYTTASKKLSYKIVARFHTHLRKCTQLTAPSMFTNRKLPKVIRQTPTGVMLDMKLKQFKSVVPLMVSLKNEAMRERHWKILMEKTGTEMSYCFKDIPT